MIAAIRSEIRKTLTTRLWWILLLSNIALVAFFAITLGAAFGFDAGGTDMEGNPIAIDPVSLATMVYTVGVGFGYVFPVILGALSVTGEVRHGTLDTTLVLQPRRGTVILAKFVAIIPFALLFAVASVATGVASGAAVFAITDMPLELGNTDVIRALLMGVVALTVWALVGVGLGTALTNQVAAIVVLLGFTQFVEPILRIVFAMVESLSAIGSYLPGAAGEAIVGASFYASAGMDSALLPPWGGVAMLLAYAAITGIVGWLTTFRKDRT